jgi:hypothetical protein
MKEARHRETGPGDQLLHLVFGGELESIDGIRFADLSKLDIVGIYPNYRTARAAWQGKAHATVDNARMRYFIVHLHRLLDPETDARPGKAAR